MKHSRLIAGLIPEATGAMSEEMQRALDERVGLIEARAESVLSAAIAESRPWAAALGPAPSDSKRSTDWHRAARVIAAYRDRYRITDRLLLGAAPDSTNQRLDRARAEAALRRVEQLSRVQSTPEPSIRFPRHPDRLTL